MVVLTLSCPRSSGSRNKDVKDGKDNKDKDAGSAVPRFLGRGSPRRPYGRATVRPRCFSKGS